MSLESECQGGLRTRLGQMLASGRHMYHQYQCKQKPGGSIVLVVFLAQCILCLQDVYMHILIITASSSKVTIKPYVTSSVYACKVSLRHINMDTYCINHSFLQFAYFIPM